MEVLSLTDNDDFVGLAITIMHEELVLLDYFAIDSMKRGSGYGGAALALLLERYQGKKFLLEIERPEESAINNEERVRRKKFYLNNGFSETGIDIKLFGVTMELLSYNCSLTFEEYQGLYKHILSNFMVNQFVKRKTINYKQLIHPDLRKIAQKIPFNVTVIKMAVLAQTLMLKMIRVPSELQCRKVTVKGYEGLDVSVEIFEPKDAAEKLPCLLYLHGGGFGYRAAPHHKKLACVYAKEANCRVVFPDYHLLPRYSFPAAYTDALAVYEWICNHTEELLIDSKRIAIGGDSAGGMLTANLCNTVEQHGLKSPCAQLLIYPATDVRMQTESMKKYYDTPLWNAVNNRKMWNMYLPNASAEERALASPMENKLPQQLPNTYIETAEYDCLHDEGILYAQKLERAGAKVELYETKATIHGYDAATTSTIVKASVAKRVAALNQAFNTD